MSRVTDMTTIKELLLECLEETGEASEALDCYYQTNDESRRACYDDDVKPTLYHCNFEGLPDDDFDAGFGGTHGPALIAFTDKYVYISSEYDGSEGITAVPRHHEHIGRLIPRV